MPKEAIIILVVFIVFIMIPAIAITVIGIKNVKQHISHEYNGHKIEIITSFTFVQLVVDNKIIDNIKSYFMATAKLQGKVDDKQIIVNIGSGFLKPKIMTYIDGEKIEALSNCWDEKVVVASLK